MTVERPIIIVGPGRSGTNALRDALCMLDEMCTWPCDEINYVWRHGNRDHPTDALTRAHARPEVRRSVTHRFERLATRHRGRHIVEKTCANSLRVEFVRAIFPRAVIVTIARDPVDTVASAMKRWTAPLDVAYLMKKARFVPKLDLAHYGHRYARSRLARASSSEGRVSTWGPRFAGIDDLVLRSTPLHEICAYQWRACVDSMESSTALLPSDDLVVVTYGDLVERPARVLGDIAARVGVEPDADELTTAASSIRRDSVGNGYRELSTDQIATIEAICGAGVKVPT